MRHYYAFDGHAFDEAKARHALLNFLRDRSLGWAWLICDEATPVGYIVLTLGYSRNTVAGMRSLMNFSYWRAIAGAVGDARPWNLWKSTLEPMAFARFIWKSCGRISTLSRLIANWAFATTITS